MICRESREAESWKLRQHANSKLQASISAYSDRHMCTPLFININITRANPNPIPQLAYNCRTQLAYTSYIQLVHVCVDIYSLRVYKQCKCMSVCIHAYCRLQRFRHHRICMLRYQ
jgi:hypothetical protein